MTRTGTQRRDYLVFLCPRCQSVRYSKSEHKTAICFNCGYQILIDSSKTKIIFRTNRRTEAKEAVKRCKMKLADRVDK